MIRMIRQILLVVLFTLGYLTIVGTGSKPPPVDGNEIEEIEPNDTFSNAQAISVPTEIAGDLANGIYSTDSGEWIPSDVDCYTFAVSSSGFYTLHVSLDKSDVESLFLSNVTFTLSVYSDTKVAIGGVTLNPFEDAVLFPIPATEILLFAELDSGIAYYTCLTYDLMGDDKVNYNFTLSST
ncbi:MAG: hypothetical protein ABFS45_13455 [Pseudomonadota bacterium]